MWTLGPARYAGVVVEMVAEGAVPDLGCGIDLVGANGAFVAEFLC